MLSLDTMTRSEFDDSEVPILLDQASETAYSVTQTPYYEPEEISVMSRFESTIIPEYFNNFNSVHSTMSRQTTTQSLCPNFDKSMDYLDFSSTITNDMSKKNTMLSMHSLFTREVSIPRMSSTDTNTKIKDFGGKSFAKETSREKQILERGMSKQLTGLTLTKSND
eukprot:UN33853